MPIKPANVDQYLESGCGRCEFGGTPQCKVQSWTEELRLLRGILKESGLRVGTNGNDLLEKQG